METIQSVCTTRPHVNSYKSLWKAGKSSENIANARVMPIQPRKTFASGSNSPSTYAFHGSNSSHSKDSGAGGRTYHMPNYATSYANEKSNLITIHLEEAKGSKRGYIVFTFLVMLLIGASMHHLSTKGRHHAEYDLAGFGTPSQPVPQVLVQEDPPLEDTSRSNESSSQQATDDSPPITESSDVYWDEPTPAERCSSYGTREYSARLWNLPFFTNWTKACNTTPTVIHGQNFERPERCERRWPFGGVIGYWKVQNQQDCSPRWGRFVEKESAATPMPASSSES